MPVVINGTTGVSGVDGSASTPSYQGTDTNTGIFFPAADTIAFGEGGTESMRIDSSGNVGIGETNPIVNLQVKNTAGSAALRLQSTEASSNAQIDFVPGNQTNPYYIYVNPTRNLIFQDNATERARITSAGEFVVGKTSTGTGVGTYIDNTGVINTQKSSSANTSTTMEVYSTGASAFRFYVGMGGTIYATSTTITGISDVRLKENIRDLDDGLNSILALKPRKFDWKEGKGKDIKDDRGFVAQEFEEVFPDLIDEWKDPAPEGEEPYKSVRADLIPVLVKAIQDLKAITDAQATRIKTLEAQNAAFEARLAALEAK